jgi:superfamily II DNA/RNA helicase
MSSSSSASSASGPKTGSITIGRKRGGILQLKSTGAVAVAAPEPASEPSPASTEQETDVRSERDASPVTVQKTPSPTSQKSGAWASGSASSASVVKSLRDAEPEHDDWPSPTASSSAKTKSYTASSAPPASSLRDTDDWGPSIKDSMRKQEVEKRRKEEDNGVASINLEDFAEGTTPDLQRITKFDEMGLSINIVRGIYSYGFEKPSPIQQLAIPAMITGRDLIAQAQSGTGKTGFMCISMLHMLEKARENYCLKHAKDPENPPCISKLPHMGMQILFMSPNKVLAEQNFLTLKDFAKYFDPPLNIQLFMGGNVGGIKEDERNCKGVDIVVGTTGRILDLVTRRMLDTSRVMLVVLDEADEFLSNKHQRRPNDRDDRDNRRDNRRDADFENEIRSIIEWTPEQAQIVIVSATMPEAALNLANAFMKDPTRILLKPETLTLDGIVQFKAVIDMRNRRCRNDEAMNIKLRSKFEVLQAIFSMIPVRQSIIFVNKKETGRALVDYMLNDGQQVAFLHAELGVAERRNVVRSFSKGECRTLVTTDIVARGFNVQSVSVVFNFDLPKDKETYLHRIGRSGRHGRKGYAINFCVTNFPMREHGEQQSDMEILESIKRHYKCTIKELQESDIEFLG